MLILNSSLLLENTMHGSKPGCLCAQCCLTSADLLLELSLLCSHLWLSTEDDVKAYVNRHINVTDCECMRSREHTDYCSPAAVLVLYWLCSSHSRAWGPDLFSLAIFGKISFRNAAGWSVCSTSFCSVHRSCKTGLPHLSHCSTCRHTGADLNPLSNRCFGRLTMEAL